MGSLDHSPANVLRYALIAAGVGTNPNSNDAWPIHCPSEPPLPDDCITITGTVGILTGFSMPDKELGEHHGVQIRIRSVLPREGYAKARSIAIKLDEMVRTSVTIESSTYRISASRTSDVIELGKERGQSDRRLFTINATVDVLQTA